MAVFVSSGDLAKSIANNERPKEAVLEALRQWGVCGKCDLGTVTTAENKAGLTYFLTTNLLDELKIAYKAVDDKIKLIMCQHCKHMAGCTILSMSDACDRFDPTKI